MKIAIMGAGMAGSYLYRLLSDEGGYEIDIYDTLKTNRCGAKPCAWGMAPWREYVRLIEEVGLNEVKYVLKCIDHISIDGVEVRANCVTIDKPRLIRDLLGRATVNYSGLGSARYDYDYIIDATGVERAYLPALKDDQELWASCTQYRIKSRNPAFFRARALGYSWCFPLGDGECHVGVGSLYKRGINYHRIPEVEGERLICKCMSDIRLSSPYYSQPFVHGNVWGVGESIGTVGPLGADGNIYSMECARLLCDNFGDSEGYTKAVLKEFGWMKREREILDKMIVGERPSIFDAWAFMQHSRRVGFKIGLRQALELLKRGKNV